MVARKRKKSIEIESLLCPEGDPYDSVEMVTKTVDLKNGDQVIFEQKGVEYPADWSPDAAFMMASKFFRGHIGTPQRESSVRQLFDRVVDTLADAGVAKGYFNAKNGKKFNAELKKILLEQMAAFNSPVFFNVGAEENPQGSACFILGVDDNLESIAKLQTEEIEVFSHGSGTGVNLSFLREAGALLSKGGWASGPLSFLIAYCAWAGTIRSGGILRRAAKLMRLDDSHPDIYNGREDGSDFISFKAAEERKARVLWDAGYTAEQAYATVAGQTANLSVGLSDKFMETVKENGDWTLRSVQGNKATLAFAARDMFNSIGKNIWECGDPGVHFADHINDWWTCPKTGPIRSSNPCSEFLCVDDTSCNLASLNLAAFFTLPEGIFHKEEYLHVARLMLIAQDILVDVCGYPTPKITQNTHDLRPLGLGFCNLGGVLMALGLPYDSEEGRHWASVFAGLLTGQAYKTSIEMAVKLGPFSEYAINKKPFMKVIRRHCQAMDQVLPKRAALAALAEDAQSLWSDVLRDGEKHGFRNCQTTLMAPTGTIGFLMDAATTGAEPELYLVRIKKMIDGGELRTPCKMMDASLETLGYDYELRAKICEDITATSDLANSAIAKEDYPVFHTAYPSVEGAECLSTSGHLLMMAAIQPLISGGISKTIGQPESVEAAEITQIIGSAWKLGLKCLTIYRENSKIDSPVKSAHARIKETAAKKTKERLPETTRAERHRFVIGSTKGYLLTSFYPDGRVAEFFVELAKEGSTLAGLMDCFSTAISMALQHGVPLSALVEMFTQQRFDPMGYTSTGNIKFCTSIVDYIFQYLERFVIQDADTTEAPAEQISAQLCTNCGNAMTRINAVCMECHHCKASKGTCTG
jgi:ribonucleoside-diphosphate reductase alpha chain